MSDLALEMRDKLLDVAGPIAWPHTKGSWLASASRRIGITARSARAILRVEHTYPHSRTVELIRAAWARKQERAEADARSELTAVNEQLVSLARRMASVDPDYFRPALEAIEQATRQIGGETINASTADRALAGEGSAER